LIFENKSKTNPKTKTKFKLEKKNKNKNKKTVKFVLLHSKPDTRPLYDLFSPFYDCHRHHIGSHDDKYLTNSIFKIIFHHFFDFFQFFPQKQSNKIQLWFNLKFKL